MDLIFCPLWRSKNEILLSYITKLKKIFVAGQRGMVGSAICWQLQKQAVVEIITRTREELDLCDQPAVHAFMKSEKPDEVILAAAKVGGIHANNTYIALQ